LGYDDHLPEIAWGADGLDYIMWYDFGIHQTGSRSELVVGRNHAGSIPRGPSRIASTQPSRWDSIGFFTTLGTGHWNSLFPDGQRIHVGWTDLRFGNPNVMATSLSTRAIVGACPGPASATPGEEVAFQIPFTNESPLFEERTLVTVTGSRAWPSMVLQYGILENAAVTLPFQVDVPDSAAPGVNTLSVTIKRQQSGLVVATCSVPLTITSTTGREGPTPVAFALDAPVPNPTRGMTRLGYGLPSSGRALLEVFGVRGERVRTLLDDPRPAGTGSVVWDARDDRGGRVAAGL
jgi:hypothetical protein